MSKPLLIALDLDNTIADFTGGFAAWLSRQPEFRTRALPAHTVYDLVQSGWFTTHEEFTHYFQAAEQDGLYESLTLADGAVAALHSLLASGHTVKAVTARSDLFAEDTVSWLTRHGLPVEEVIHTEAKETVPADLFIDDAPSQIVKLFGSRELLVPTMPYNTHLAAECHFTDWADVPHRVETLRQALTDGDRTRLAA